MYPENHLKTQSKRGRIEVICGSMYSGKTEELIRRLKRAGFAKQKVEIYKPEVDTRYDEKEVVSHNDNRIISTPVPASVNILLLASTDADVIGIDEAQFFDEGLPEVCQTLADKGIRVIVAGLDTDFKGRPFGPIPELMAMAEEVTKVHAVCVDCGYTANCSHRLNNSENLVLLGEKDIYIPLCRECNRARKET